MMKTGLLVVSNPNIVFRTLPIIQSEINNTIYIQYFPAIKWSKSLTLKSTDRVSKIPYWPMYSSTVIGLYSKMLHYKNLDVNILLSGIKSQELCKTVTKKPVELVYYDQLFIKEEVHKYICTCVQSKTVNCQVIALPDDTKVSAEDDNNEVTEEQTFDNVVLGGTFDRLHYGHKILLSEAILRCRKKITVGVTDTPMLKSKKLWELVEPCELRMQKVRDFLVEVDKFLEYDVVSINDIYGPTKDDPTFQMIVVSSETVGGGDKINEIREANGLDPLCIHKVELLVDVNKEDIEEEDKISSSNLRLRCLGTLLRTPQQNSNIPERPYIIGLTGGIASGKTKIANYLERLGVGVIDCDKIAHDIYKVSTPGHTKVIEFFGQEILDKTGAVDRKKLGAIVFNDKAKMKALNELLWPLILQEAQARAQDLHSKGYSVVVMEAAVLIKAQWTNFCHEVWVSIIPPNEAIKRVMERNRLTEDEAKARVESQLPNTEQVKHANVVFSTLWRPEFTERQVIKAWTGLKERLGLQ